MKISDLINNLEKIKLDVGDIECCIQNYDVEDYCINAKYCYTTHIINKNGKVSNEMWCVIEGSK